MNLFPENIKDQRIQTDVHGLGIKQAFMAHFEVNAVNATVSSANGIHAGVASTATSSILTTEITNPSVPRNITATAAGVATDIKAIQVIVEGTNYNNEVITETLPAFTVAAAGTVIGNKAFKTITKITIPDHDGIGATTAIGFGEKIGLPYKLSHNTILATYLDNIREVTAPTITTSAISLENNTIDLSSALNSKVIDAYLIV